MSGDQEYRPLFPEIETGAASETPAWLTRTKTGDSESTAPTWVRDPDENQRVAQEVRAKAIGEHLQAEEEAYARGLAEGARQAEALMEEGQERLLARLRGEVSQEGHEQGFKIGEKAGYEAGYEAGKEEASKESHEQIALLRSIINSVQVWQAAQEKQQLQELGELVAAFTQQVVAAELELNTGTITKVLTAALQALPKTTELPIIEINPADHDQVEKLREEGEKQWLIIEDDTIQAGGCRIKTSQSDVDATVERRLRLAQDVIKDAFLELA